MRILFLLSSFCFLFNFSLFGQPNNDFNNCQSNYSEVLCIPWVSDTLEGLNDNHNLLLGFGVDSYWEFGFAVKSNNEFSYYYFRDMNFGTGGIITVRVFYSCNSVAEASCVTGSPQVPDGCQPSTNFDQSAYSYIPIVTNSSYQGCSAGSQLDPCNPCPTNSLCVDPSRIDPTVFCSSLYDPVCGCDGNTYSNSCKAEFEHGIIDVQPGPCPNTSCIDSSRITNNVCITLYDPVCGCDGKTYSNACVAENYYGIISVTQGACSPNTCIDSTQISLDPCPLDYNPVCGCNGVTYPNGCAADRSGVINYTPGSCLEDCQNPDLINPDLICPALYDPVCGCNGKTYSNDCYALADGITNFSLGTCEGIKCDSFIYVPLPILGPPDDPAVIDLCGQEPIDPICGCDGITYDNACFAFANGIYYFEPGPCANSPCKGEPLDSLVFCPALYDPVCGCNGKTYSNECYAISDGVGDWQSGTCPPVSCPSNDNEILCLPWVQNIMIAYATINICGTQNGFTNIQTISKGFYQGDQVIIVRESFTDGMFTNGYNDYAYNCNGDLIDECGSFSFAFWCNPDLADGAILNGIQNEVQIWECANGIPSCNNPVCGLPINQPLSETDLSNTGVTLQFGFTSYSKYEWRYRELNTGTWTNLGISSITERRLDGLSDCTDYEWQVRLRCYNQAWSSWSNTKRFKTTGTCTNICSIPTSYTLSESNITETEVRLQLNTPVSNYSLYEWRVENVAQGNGPISQGTSTTGTKVVVNLDDCSNYEWQVRVRCDNDIWSDWFGVGQFETLCPPQPCIITANYQLDELNVTQTSATLDFSLNGFLQYRWQYRIPGNSWIPAGSTGISSQTISGLATCQNYEWQVDVQCLNGEWTGWLGLGTFETVCPPEPCVVATNYQIDELNVSETSATLDFNLNGFSQYRWQYRTPNNNWISAGSTSISSQTISGLANCQTYEWQVNVQCDNGQWSGWFGMGQFETICPPQPCVVTANYQLDELNVSETSATLDFNLNGFSQYRWQYRTPNNNWISAGSTSISSQTISGLTNCQTYEWQVNVQCDNGQWSDWFGSGQFETICPPQPCVVTANYQLDELNVSETEATLDFNLNGFSQYRWQYRILGNNWISAGSTSISSQTISGLTNCQTYEWQVNVQCDNGQWSGWFGMGQFETICPPQPCVVTANYQLDELNVSETSATLDFNLNGFSQYRWRYRTPNNNWISAGSTSISSQTISGLANCQTYEWQVNVQCDNGQWSGWLGISQFETLCPTCDIPQSYTLDEPLILQTEASFQINTGTFQAYDWRFRSTNQNSWIDLDETSIQAISVTGLIPCEAYTWQVKVRCTNGIWSDWFGNNSFTTTCPPTCVVPQVFSLSETNITETEAKLELNLQSYIGYEWRYRGIDQSIWIDKRTNVSALLISNLDPCKNYVWQVKAQCPNGIWTDWFGNKQFMTACPAPVCDAPQGYVVAPPAVSETEAIVQVNLQGYQKYFWRLRTTADPNWRPVIETTVPSVDFLGLSGCTAYIWEIKVQCSNSVQSDWFGLDQFQTSCLPQNCPAPTIFSANSTVNQTAAMLQTDLQNYSKYDWRLRKRGAQIWEHLPETIDNTTSIFGLTICQEYEWQLRVECDDSIWSNWFGFEQFITDCPPQNCAVPTNYDLETLMISETVATLEYSLQNYQEYGWRYRLSGSIDWIDDFKSFTGSTEILGLAPCTDYEWQVKVRCQNDLWSGWFGLAQFTTDCDSQDCLPPFSYDLNTIGLGTNNVTLQTNLSGYLQYNWRYKIVSSNQWLGFIPSDLSEKQLSNLIPCSDYEWQVRGQCSNSIWSDWFGNEKFTTDCISQVCDTPVNTVFTADSIRENSATIKTDLSGYLRYNWQYRIVGTINWINGGTSSLSEQSLSGLVDCQDYEWQIRLQCDNLLWSDWFGDNNFTTECTPTCNVPQNYRLLVNDITETSAHLSINIDSFEEYEWQIRPANSLDWINIGSTNEANIFVENLNKCTEYEWQLRLKCSNNVWSDWLGSGVFTTECPTSVRDKLLEAGVWIYPNPTTGRVSIETPAKITNLIIRDLHGRLIRVIEGDQNKLNMSDLTSGIYMIQINFKNFSSIRKVIKY